MIGLVSAPYFNWKFEKQKWVKWVLVILFICFLSFSSSDMLQALDRRLCAVTGVFALFFVCEFVSNCVFEEHTKGIVAIIISNISYASMACYMFHRFFFLAGGVGMEPIYARNKVVIYGWSCISYNAVSFLLYSERV
jgi:hypothetical protein